MWWSILSQTVSSKHLSSLPLSPPGISSHHQKELIDTILYCPITFFFVMVLLAFAIRVNWGLRRKLGGVPTLSVLWECLGISNMISGLSIWWNLSAISSEAGVSFTENLKWCIPQTHLCPLLDNAGPGILPCTPPLPTGSLLGCARRLGRWEGQRLLSLAVISWGFLSIPICIKRLLSSLHGWWFSRCNWLHLLCILAHLPLCTPPEAPATGTPFSEGWILVLWVPSQGS